MKTSLKLNISLKSCNRLLLILPRTSKSIQPILHTSRALGVEEPPVLTDSDTLSDRDKAKNGPSSRGYPELVFCSFLWGTYSPTLKLIYAEDHPMDAATLTAVRTLFAAAALAAAVVLNRSSSSAGLSSLPGATGNKPSELLEPAAICMHIEPSEMPVKGSTEERNSFLPASSGSDATIRQPLSSNLLLAASSSVIIAGVELGMYNFAGTSLQAVGLQLTSATKAGFVIQSTAVLTPAISYLAGQEISGQMWGAVVVGIMGSLLVAYDGVAISHSDDPVSLASSSDVQGSLYLLAACVFYSLSIVRLGIYAPRFPSVDLTAVKKFTLCAACFSWFLAFELQQHSELSALSLDGQLEYVGISGRSLSSWALIIFSALGPGALATYLQTKGQSTVTATQAQVIFSMAPLWSALIAQVTLGGGEVMGPLSWAGGAAVIVASLIATQPGKTQATD